jgi:hypothetical protein
MLDPAPDPARRMARRCYSAEFLPSGLGRRSRAVPWQWGANCVLLVIERENILDFFVFFAGVFPESFISSAISRRVMFVTKVRAGVRLVVGDDFRANTALPRLG